MPQFSSESLAKLQTVHPDLQVLLMEVIKHVDIAILEGHRDQAAQEKAFAQGNTKLHWPHGKHNATPSCAVDVAPFPVDFSNAKRFYYVAGLALGLAAVLKAQGKMKHDVRWGGNWSQNAGILDEHGLIDLPHLELMGV